MSIKYEIYTDVFSIEFDKRAEVFDKAHSAHDILSDYMAQDGTMPKLVKSFDSEDSAKKYFKENFSGYGDTRLIGGYPSGYALVGQLAFIAEYEYDENGDMVSFGGVSECSVEPFDEIEGDYFERFESLSEDAPHTYSAANIAAMSDSELVDEINRLPDWDADLLADLIWRAYEKAPCWEVGDETCYRAAAKLGCKLN